MIVHSRMLYEGVSNLEVVGADDKHLLPCKMVANQLYVHSFAHRQ